MSMVLYGTERVRDAGEEWRGFVTRSLRRGFILVLYICLCIVSSKWWYCVITVKQRKSLMSLFPVPGGTMTPGDPEGLHLHSSSKQHLLKRPPVDIEFTDLTYSVPQGRTGESFIAQFLIVVFTSRSARKEQEMLCLLELLRSLALWLTHHLRTECKKRNMSFMRFRCS